MQSQRATLVTVADAAGVSRQTVSNVLNAPERVRPETRARIHALIKELDYRPSLAARQLRTSRSRTLGLRMEPERDGVNGLVLDRFLHALVEAAQGAAYRIQLYTADSDEAEVGYYADLFPTSQLDGLILTSTHHGDYRTAWLTEHGIPFSTFGRPWGAATDQHAWVDIDGAAGTEEAVRHLSRLGHRRIAFVGWPAGSGVGDDRRTGWRRGLRAAGLAVVPQLDVFVENDMEQGAEHALRLLDGAEPPTAFVCASDSLALGAMRAAERVAGHAGERAAVIGFDDTSVAAAVGLSSIAQPLGEAARECLRQVLAAIARDSPRPRTALLAPTLVLRSTTPPPPSPPQARHSRVGPQKGKP